ncbi:MAG: OsmC family protein [Armatimonadetes bacterium]|nr:OsmC family protein [Armatimonadota bacterium]
MAKLHEYPVTVQWQGGRGGSGKVTADTSGSSSTLAVPAEFGGTGGGTNPEEMLCEAVASCYSITFGIIADMRKLPVVGFEVKAVGEVEENGPTFTYKKITIRPTITLASDASDDQMKMAEDMSHKADSYCIITNAVRGKVEIVVEPTLSRA